MALVSNLDLVPTLVTAAGGDDPDLHGTPLQRGLDGSAERSSVLVQISESQVGRALRTSDHTYAVKGQGLGPLAGYRYAQAASYTDHLLYDLNSDPAQRHNLATDPGTVELRHTLAAQLVDQIEHFEGYRPALAQR